MILVISHEGDQHALVVLDRLARQNTPALMFDTARFPAEARVAIRQTAEGQSADLIQDGRAHALDAVRRIWWRRPRGFGHDPALTRPEDVNFVHNESHAAIGGLWQSVEAEWINPPDRDEAACHKVWQLKLAAELGLPVPRTLVTNDPDAARAFVAAERPKGTIYKAFTATEAEWRETRLLKPGEEAGLDQVRFAPVIFQEHVEADIDLRITVIGDEIFPAAVHSGETAYKVDFRMTIHDARVEPHRLPDAVAERLFALMRRLGLVYGAIDMRLTPAGDYVFLEINPSGQWLFIEDRTGQPITDAFVARLARA